MFSEDYSSAAPPSAPQTPRAHQLLSASYAALSSMAQGSASAAAASRLHEALAAAAAAPRADAQQSTLGAAIAGKERELRDMHEFRVASLEALLRARDGEIAAARADAADAVAAAADARADAADARARLAKLKDDFQFNLKVRGAAWYEVKAVAATHDARHCAPRPQLAASRRARRRAGRARRARGGGRRRALPAARRAGCI